MGKSALNFVVFDWEFMRMLRSRRNGPPSSQTLICLTLNLIGTW
jgi:hypothetical protein